MRLRFPLRFLLFGILLTRLAISQSPNCAITGLVVDPAGRSIVAAEILIVNDATGLKYPTTTNTEGLYTVKNLVPGTYRIQVSKIGFKTLIKPDVTLSVQAAVAINFTLPIGAFSETVTVEGGAPLLNTESATVSTVVDRQFAENLPLNGRTFQSLIDLTPGVVLTVSNGYDDGQFSVNGQRSDANYWMVDGVSANIGIGVANPGSGIAGSLGSFSVLGGTNSLVSVDALQEFRIQTSTYAPEFGRTPGGQISIVTRSGTNRFRGTVFDYLRNDVLDANDWFANRVGLPKAKERQNDFGGTFNGPIIKDKTFFFFSYEGLRLRLPQTALTTVPSLDARTAASDALRPYFNAYPMPNGPIDAAAGTAEFNASYSNPASLDAYSLRVDHRLNNKWNFFGRYNYSPSSTDQRGAGGSLSTVLRSRIVTQTATFAVNWAPSPSAVNDFRFNFSRTSGSSSEFADDFGGAAPLTAPQFPDGLDLANASLAFDIGNLEGGLLNIGRTVQNVQRQLNWVDNFSYQHGKHALKAGIDFRRMSPEFDPHLYQEFLLFSDVPSAANGDLLLSFIASHVSTTALFRNLGAFAQDTWQVFPRLTLTYGLRWDVDYAPSAINGPVFPAVTGFQLNDLSTLGLAPANTRPFSTTYGNIAPRLGLAYGIARDSKWASVLHAGAGLFYDLASTQVGGLIWQSDYPYGSNKFTFGGTFPLDSVSAAPAPIVPPGGGSGTVTAFDPHLKLPYTLQWNLGLEQSLGKQQVLSATYVGARGRRLIQTTDVFSPNDSFSEAILVANTSTSDYNALQVQFRRQLTSGLQALSSYTWSHSIDTASAGSFGESSNTFVPGVDANVNRGASDFDVRNAFSAGLSYNVPSIGKGRLPNAILRGWSLQNLIQARSAPPVNVNDSNFSSIFGGSTDIRPDVVPGVPLYLHGGQYPGNKRLNSAAFVAPPTDPVTGDPTRQGNLPRNGLRGFGATQWDFAVHREFPIREDIRLQFRAEMFNVLNHPNFAQPIGDITNSRFGLSTQMLGQGLGSGGVAGSGGLNSLYQLGGPRSIQVALKLFF